MPSETDEKWRWKLRLFASADLVGSTAYKVNQSRNKTPDWASTFREFFNDFPAYLLKQYEALPSSKHGKCPKTALKPWKFLGDECLFETELATHQDSAFHVMAFKHAIKRFPERWKEKGTPLLLKGTMWIAGFPVGNRELTLRSDGRDITDYIGPSIDTGFRITKFSSERKLALSVDLCLLLVEALDVLEWYKESHQIAIRFSGCEPLKGVLDGKPYPVIYLHLFDGVKTTEEELLEVSHETNTNKLKKYLREYVDAHLHRPFMATDTNEKFRIVPDGFEIRREAMRSDEEGRDFGKQQSAAVPSPEGAVIELDPPVEKSK